MDLSSNYYAGVFVGSILGWAFSEIYRTKFLSRIFFRKPRDLYDNDLYESDSFTDNEEDERSSQEIDWEHPGHEETGGSKLKSRISTLLSVEEDRIQSTDENTIILRLSDNVTLQIFEKLQTREEEFNPRETERELTDIFNATETVQQSSTTTQTGGYIRMVDFGKLPEPDVDALPASEERRIIREYSSKLLFMNYDDACKEAAKDNYNLHVLYVGLGKKMPLSSYSSTTLGVRIKDPRWEGKPSTEAIIQEIIDVGGVDTKNKGIIKL